MKVKILSYSEQERCHHCIDDKGKRHSLDLVTDASFPDFEYKTDEDLKNLAGREVEIDHTFPYISFACGVKFTDK